MEWRKNARNPTNAKCNKHENWRQTENCDGQKQTLTVASLQLLHLTTLLCVPGATWITCWQTLHCTKRLWPGPGACAEGE